MKNNIFRKFKDLKGDLYMITGELRSKVDKIWETFWTGGITNPLEVIEQFTYLLFIKGLDDKEIVKENDALLLGIDFDRTFQENKQNLRWSKFKNFEAETMYDVVANEVFPFIKSLHTNKDSAYAKYMGDAIFKIPTPLMLSKIVDGLIILIWMKIRILKEIFMNTYFQR